MATTHRVTAILAMIMSGMTVLDRASAEALPRSDVVAGDTSCLVLEWMDPHELLPAGERWMAKETSRILGAADIGARWDWSNGEERVTLSERRRREHRLRVILVPSEPSGPGWGLTPNTLGATVMDGQTAPPAVYIFYRSVVSLLGRRAQDLSDPFFLGPASRALGRVVAHEIAHALAPDEPHASSGLMQAGLARTMWTAKQAVAIDGRWQRVLGAGLAQLCPAGPSRSEQSELSATVKR